MELVWERARPRLELESSEWPFKVNVLKVRVGRFGPEFPRSDVMSRCVLGT